MGRIIENYSVSEREDLRDLRSSIFAKIQDPSPPAVPVIMLTTIISIITSRVKFTLPSKIKSITTLAIEKKIKQQTTR